MGISEELGKLAELRSAGAISADEFEAAKASLLLGLQSDTGSEDCSDALGAARNDDLQHTQVTASPELQRRPSPVVNATPKSHKEGNYPGSGYEGPPASNSSLQSAEGAKVWSALSELMQENRLKPIARQDFERLLDSDPRLATLLEAPPELLKAVAVRMAKSAPVGLEGLILGLRELEDRGSKVGVRVVLSALVAALIGALAAFFFVSQAPDRMSSELANGWASVLAVVVGTLAALLFVAIGARRLEYSWRQTSLILLLPLAGCLASGSLWLGSMSDSAQLPWEDRTALPSGVGTSDESSETSESEPETRSNEPELDATSEPRTIEELAATCDRLICEAVFIREVTDRTNVFVGVDADTVLNFGYSVCPLLTVDAPGDAARGLVSLAPTYDVTMSEQEARTIVDSASLLLCE